jgi:hypothetical protein
MARHNAIIAWIKKAVVRKFEVLYEYQFMSNHCLPPDLVQKKGLNIFILDATVVFENRMAAFQSAAAEKKVKYEELRSEMAIQHVMEVAVVLFVVGSLGA